MRGWIWPGLILLLLGVLLATFWTEASWLAGTAGVYAPVVYAVGLFLAWRYRQSRVAAVLLGLFMMDVLLRPSNSTLESGVGSVWDASGVLFLVLLPVVAAMKDRRVLSPRGLIQVGVILAGLAGGLMVWAVRPRVPVVDLATPPSVGPLRTSVVGCGASGGFVRPPAHRGTSRMAESHRLGKGFFWVALALVLVLRNGPGSLESTIYLTMAGVMLIVNVLEKSYALSLHDNVTHLPARRALRREIRRAGSPYALALVSVDHFDTLHDRYGRDVSDRVIKKNCQQFAKGRSQRLPLQQGKLRACLRREGAQ